MKLFITGVNGFIGTHLLENILAKTDWEVDGFDIASTNLEPYEGENRFAFRKGCLLYTSSHPSAMNSGKQSPCALPNSALSAPSHVRR